MAGAIIIVVVLLMIPVVMMMSGGIAAAVLGQALEGRRGAPRGQRAARTRRLVPCTPQRGEAALTAGHRQVRHRPGATRSAAARRPADARRAARRAGTRSPRRASAAWRRCASSARSSPPPASPSTTHGSCPSCRRPRPRRRSCSTSSSARRASTADRGWRAAAPCSPRTRRCAGSPTSPACRRRPAACSSAGARRATSARWSPPAGGGGPRRRRPRPHAGSAARVQRCPLVGGAAARAMDADVASVPADARGRLQPPSAARHRRRPRHRRSRSPVRHRRHERNHQRRRHRRPRRAPPTLAADVGTWFHVDGAYGGAALAAPSVRRRFDGIEAADSFIVDPHKWLFAPFDSCALLYRDPEIGRHAHTQHAEYLDVLHGEDDEHEWNPSDYAHHLSRRARGLPLWFSLATHGTQAYTDAIETTLRVTREGAELVRSAPHLELIVEPELSVVLFRRIGWDRRRLQGVERPASWRPSSRSSRRQRGGRDGAALVHRQPADDGRRPRRDRRQPGRRPAPWLTPPPIWSSPARGAWRRWTPSGASSPVAGSPSPTASSPRSAPAWHPRPTRSRSTPATAWSRRASSTPTTTSSRT